MPDPRTDHPPLGVFLGALANDYAQALRENPAALAEIDLTVSARVWGVPQTPGLPPEVLVDFNEPRMGEQFTIRLRPSPAYIAEQDEVARERVSELQQAFVQRMGGR